MILILPLILSLFCHFLLSQLSLLSSYGDCYQIHSNHLDIQMQTQRTQFVVHNLQTRVYRRHKRQSQRDDTDNNANRLVELSQLEFQCVRGQLSLRWGEGGVWGLDVLHRKWKSFFVCCTESNTRGYGISNIPRVPRRKILLSFSLVLSSSFRRLCQTFVPSPFASTLFIVRP